MPTCATQLPGSEPTVICSPGSHLPSEALSAPVMRSTFPFVFGTVHNPVVQNFSGGGDDAFALSASIRASWTAFARVGSPEDAQPLASRRGHGSLPGLEPEVWSNWDPDRRPTTVLGPWPGSPSLCTLVDAPRNEEASVVATLRAPL